MKLYIKIFIILFFGILFSGCDNLSKIDSYNTSLKYSTNQLIKDNTQNNKITSLNKSIYIGQEWIINFQKEDGLFNYIYLPYNNSFPNDQNMVRQIGSFYGLIKIYEYTKDNRSLNLINKFRVKIQDYIKYSQINNTKIAYIEYDGISKVNSAAMYILSMSELSRQGFNLTIKEKEDLKRLIEGIYFMENETGGLWYIYYLPEEYNKITPYGTGEALFGLISYYKYVKKDKKLLNFTKKHFNLYYNISKTTQFQEEDARAFYAWVLYYLYELNEIEPGQQIYIEELLIKAMNYREKNINCENKGCIMMPYNMGEASFLEGTSAAYNLINNESLKLEIYNYLEKSKDMLSDMQIKSVQDYETKSGNKFNGDEKYLLGGFCDSAKCYKVRNDYSQHVLLGFINIINNVYE